MDVELPGMDALERIPKPPPPKYRVTYATKIEGYVEFSTDEDPATFLEDDDNAEEVIDHFLTWGNYDLDYWPGFGRKIEVEVAGVWVEYEP